jgi:hypothetical protein
VLAVVQDEQHLPLAQGRSEGGRRIRAARMRQVEHIGDLDRDCVGIGQPLQADPHDTVAPPGRLRAARPNRQPGLAAPARAEQGQRRPGRDRGVDQPELLAPSHEGRELRRQLNDVAHHAQSLSTSATRWRQIGQLADVRDLRLRQAFRQPTPPGRHDRKERS